MQHTQPTILIVEDEKSLLEAWKNKFQRQGFDVLTATNGKAALDTALKCHPDMVVTDLVMPSSDGLTLTKKLREDKWGQQVPVMYLSGWLGAEGEEDRPQPDPGQKTPAKKDYYLGGNWSVEQVLKEVRRKLGVRQLAL
jgi:CheY-like chemotaxis protein